MDPGLYGRQKAEQKTAFQQASRSRCFYFRQILTLWAEF